jgi:hypothetical protein
LISVHAGALHWAVLSRERQCGRCGALAGWRARSRTSPSFIERDVDLLREWIHAFDARDIDG